jgi:hypothetical protein
MSTIINPPDFEDVMEIVERIRELSLQEAILSNKIKFMESDITAEATENEKYFVNGKPPSMTYINSTYKVTGFDGELKKLRNDLAQIQSELEYRKNLFSVKKDMLEVWRTESANQRASVL